MSIQVLPLIRISNKTDTVRIFVKKTNITVRIFGYFITN